MVVAPKFGLGRGVASVPTLKNWGLENNVGNSHIHAVDAWRLAEGSRDVVVAVIDTGIDPRHPDIKPNLWHDATTGVYGWDFVSNKANPNDDHGHGTHVAGILGAAMNAKSGVSGVAHRVSIMAVKYYSDQNSGAQNLQNSIKALNWAIDHGAKIINYSGGGPEFSGDEYAALKRAREKGILLVAAAGNEHKNSDVPESFYYPCAYRLDNIICVASINIHNKLLPSSNWGRVRVDVAAPGENILSTAPGGRYAYMSGTSQATAFVTGLAALMLSKDKALKPDQIRDIVRSSVDRIPALADKVGSGGKLNAYAALAALDRKTVNSSVAIVKTEPKLESLKEQLRKISSKKAKKATASAKVSRPAHPTVKSQKKAHGQVPIETKAQQTRPPGSSAPLERS